MRFTRRRSGQKMTTLLVKHHVGVDDFARVLAHSLCHSPWDLPRGESVDALDPETWPRQIGRDRIAAIARETYATKGREAADYWTDDLDTAIDADDVLAWATRVVRNAFPEA